MDVFTLARACVRRWYVFVPLLVITAVVSLVQARGIKPLYGRSAVVVLLPSNSVPKVDPSARAQPINPLTSVGVAQSALITRLSSGNAAVRIANATNGTGGYGLAGQKGGGGQITVAALGSTPAIASGTLAAVLRQARTQLRDLQAAVRAPSGSYFKIYLLNRDVDVSKSYPQRSRNIVLIALAGVLLSILLTQLADYLFGVRTARRLYSRHAFDEQLPQSSSSSMDLSPEPAPEPVYAGRQGADRDDGGYHGDDRNRGVPNDVLGVFDSPTVDDREMPPTVVETGSPMREPRFRRGRAR